MPYQYLDNRRGPGAMFGQVTNTFGDITRDIMRMRAEQEYRNQMLGIRGQDIAVDQARLAAQSPYYAAQAQAELAKAQEIQAKIEAANQLGLAARGGTVDMSQGPTAQAGRGLNTADLYQAGARSAALSGNAAQFFTPHSLAANTVGVNAFGQRIGQGPIQMQPGEYYRDPLNPYPEIAPENITLNPGQVFVNTAQPGMSAGGSPYAPPVGAGGMTPGVAGNLWRDMNEYADLTGVPNPMMTPVEQYLLQAFRQSLQGGGGGAAPPGARPYYDQGGQPQVQQQPQMPQQPQMQVPQGLVPAITNTVFPQGQAPQLGMQPSQRPTPRGVPSQAQGGPPNMGNLPKPKPRLQPSAQQPRPTQGATQMGPPKSLAQIHGMGIPKGARGQWPPQPGQQSSVEKFDTPQQARAAGLQPGMAYYQPGWGIVRLKESGGVERETFGR